MEGMSFASRSARSHIGLNTSRQEGGVMTVLETATRTLSLNQCDLDLGYLGRKLR